MSTAIGSVSFVEGQVVAVAPDGTERMLALGDQVMADEIIRTGPDGSIEITMMNGEPLALASGQTWLAAEAGMATAGLEGGVGVVSVTAGQVVAVAADGSERVLMAGDVIFADEVIRTSPDGRAEITMESGNPVTLSGSQSWLASADTYTPVDQFDTSEATADVAALQQAILAGQDPTEILEPTAAGAPAAGAPAGGNEGADFVQLNRTAGETTPEAGYDTIGLGYTVLTPEGEEPLLEMLPVVTVEVTADDPNNPGQPVTPIDPTDPTDPQAPTEPDPENPVLISGNSVSILEGSDVDNVREVTFNLVLDKAFSQDVTVTYRLNGGTALHGEDWLDGPSPDHTYTITIPAGEISFPVTVYIVQDKLDEADTESFGIQLLSANNATINPNADAGVITIFDDDTTPVANDDANQVTEDDYAEQQEVVSTSGNVIGGGSASASDVADTDEDGDMPFVTEFTNGSDVAQAGQILAGQYGTLTIAADGSYTYELTSNSSEFVQGLDEGQTLADQFSYTITDGYNEPQTAALTITIKGEADAPQVNVVAAASFTEGEASEGDLAFTFTGSDPDTAFDDLTFTLTNNPYLQIGTPATETTPGTIVLTQAGVDAINADVPIEQLMAEVIVSDGSLEADDSATTMVTPVDDGPFVDVVAANSFTEGAAGLGDVAFTYTGSDPDTAFEDLVFTLATNPYLEIGTQATETTPGTLVLTQAGVDAINANVPISQLSATMTVDDGTSTDSDTATTPVGSIDNGPFVDVVAANSFTEGAAGLGDVAFTYTGSDPDTAFEDLVFTLATNPYLEIGTQATETTPGTLVLTQAGVDAINANVPISQLSATMTVDDGTSTDSDTATTPVGSIDNGPFVDVVAANSFTEGAAGLGDVAFTYTGSDPDTAFEDLVFTLATNPYLEIGTQATETTPGTLVLTQAGVDAINANVPISQLSATMTVDDGTSTDSDTATTPVGSIDNGPFVDVVAANSFTEGAAGLGDVAFTYTGSDPDTAFEDLVFTLATNPYLEIGTQATETTPGTLVLTQAGVDAINANVPISQLSVTMTVDDGTSTDSDTATTPVTPVNDDPTISTDAVTVSEEGLVGGLPDSEGNPDTTNAVVASGQVHAEDVEGDTLTYSLSAPSNSLSSGGQPISWTGNGTGTNGLTGATQLTGATTSATIIVVSIDANGAWAAELQGPIDHADGTSEDQLFFNVGVTVDDGNGGTAFDTVSITVEDDSPAFSLVNDGSDADAVVSIAAPNPGAAQTFYGQFVDWSLGADGFQSVNLTLPANVEMVSSSETQVVLNLLENGDVVATLTLNAEGLDSLEVVHREGDISFIPVAATSAQAGGPAGSLIVDLGAATAYNIIVSGSDGDNLVEVGGANGDDDLVNTSNKGWAVKGVNGQTNQDGQSITFSFVSDSDNTTATGIPDFKFLTEGYTGGISTADIIVRVYTDATLTSYDELHLTVASGQVIQVTDLDWSAVAGNAQYTPGDSIYAVQVESEETAGSFRLNGIEVGDDQVTPPNDLFFGTIGVEVVDADGDSASQGFSVTLDGEDPYGGNIVLETIVGTSGNDSLTGGLGNDILIGGSGDDLLIGGEGDDIFVWQNRDAGTDTLTDFDIADASGFGNDVLDLSDLLAPTVDTTDIGSYLEASYNGNTDQTTIGVYAEGNAGAAGTVPDQVIVVNGDLTDLSTLIVDGNLVVDNS